MRKLSRVNVSRTGMKVGDSGGDIVQVVLCTNK